MNKIREGYKVTELGEIPNEWSIMKLSEIAEINPRREVLEDKDTVSFIAMEDITNNGRVINKTDKLYEEVKKGYTPFKDNDVLLAKITPCFENGKRALVGKLSNGIGFGSTEFHVLRANKESISKFLYYVISSHRFMSKAENNMTGSAGQKRVPTEFIKDYVLAVPTIKEQEKIASILSTIDEQIDNVDALIEKNKELKKGLMQTLFTKGIGHTKFKNTEIGEIPEEWDVKKIGDICEVKGGKRLPKGYQLEDKDNAFPYIRVADMYMGGIRQDDIKYVPKDIVDKIKNYKISKDDLFISVAGTLGIVGQVPYELDGANLTENADKLCNIQINKLYLMKVLQSNIVQSIIEAEQTKSAQPKLALTRIKEFLIPVPSDIEQVKIASILMEVDEKIGQYKNKKQKLEELKKGLMQQLLTGMIRVTV